MMMHVMNQGMAGGVSVDKAFPRGSIFFSEGANPNAAFPNTTWTRIAAGRVLVGLDEADTACNAVHKTGGAKTVALAVANNPTHAHPFTGAAAVSSTASHAHLVRAWQYYNDDSAGTTAMGTGGHVWITSDAAGHTHTTAAAANGTVGNAGAGAAHNNLQPYVTCEIWERTDGEEIPATLDGNGNGALQKLYPVGALLYATKDVRPNNLYGGSWTRIKGRCVVFVNESDADFAKALLTGGSKTVALALANLPVHNHPYTGSAIGTSNAGAHTHSLPLKQAGQSGETPTDTWHTADRAFSSALSTVSHTHTVAFAGTVAGAGSGAAHENRQPFLTCYLWYRAA